MHKTVVCLFSVAIVSYVLVESIALAYVFVRWLVS